MVTRSSIRLIDQRKSIADESGLQGKEHLTALFAKPAGAFLTRAERITL
jgi:hypothetical protein